LAAAGEPRDVAPGPTDGPVVTQSHEFCNLAVSWCKTR
jgi:hypothetical protein